MIMAAISAIIVFLRICSKFDLAFNISEQNLPKDT